MQAKRGAYCLVYLVALFFAQLTERVWFLFKALSTSQGAMLQLLRRRRLSKLMRLLGPPSKGGLSVQL